MALTDTCLDIILCDLDDTVVKRVLPTTYKQEDMTRLRLHDPVVSTPITAPECGLLIPTLRLADLEQLYAVLEEESQQYTSPAPAFACFRISLGS